VKDTTVAARYAKALFLVTEKHKETERALEHLRGVAELFASDVRIANAFSSPELRLADKRAALKAALAKRALPIVAVFLDLLLRKKRLDELAQIVTAYEALMERAQGIQRAHLVSAVPFTRSDLKRLHQDLEQVTHSTIKLTTEVDEALLGGAMVRIGDRVIDRSVRTLLRAIRDQLEAVSV